MIKIIQNKLLFINDNYYLKVDNAFTPVNGKKYSLPDYPNLDLFLHKNKIGFWCVVDGFTCCRITKFYKDLPKAIAELKRYLVFKPEAWIMNKIFASLSSRSLSPRYRYIANPTRKTCGILKK